MFAALPDDFVAGGMRNEMGKAFQRDGIAVVEVASMASARVVIRAM